MPARAGKKGGKNKTAERLPLKKSSPTADKSTVETTPQTTKNQIKNNALPSDDSSQSEPPTNLPQSKRKSLKIKSNACQSRQKKGGKKTKQPQATAEKIIADYQQVRSPSKSAEPTASPKLSRKQSPQSAQNHNCKPLKIKSNACQSRQKKGGKNKTAAGYR